jgi:hypothetical protein
MAGELVTALDFIVEERLSPGIRDSLPALDDLWNDLFTSSMGVNREDIGRDYQVVHTFAEGVSGSIKWVSVQGQSEQFASSHIRGYADAGLVSFPGLNDQVSPGYFQKKLTLAKAMGNMLVPHEWLRMARLSAAIEDGALAIVKGTARNVALAEINAWYAEDHTGILGKVAVDPGAAAVVQTVVIKDGSIRNFHSGMHVDVYTSADPPVLHTDTAAGVLDLVVDSVRYIPNESTDTGGYGVVALRNKSGVTVDMLINQLIVRKGSLNLGASLALTDTFGPFGPEYWLADTGTVFNINLATYTQLQSIVKAVSGVLTEQILSRYFGRFFQAYGMMDMPDTLITSMGVTNAYMENADGLGRWDRTGKPLVVSGGWDFGAVPFTFNGMNMKWRISPFMPSQSDVTAASPAGGRLWALKLRDQNIVRYVPPSIPQSKSQAPFPSEVEFMYPLVNSIFKPYHDSGGKTTQWQEAPLYRYVVYCPTTMQGIKMTSLAESL